MKKSRGGKPPLKERKMETVKDLKEFLQEQLDNLECYDDDQELKIASNTYFLTRAGATNILETPNGFVDLDNPVKENNEENDEEEE